MKLFTSLLVLSLILLSFFNYQLKSKLEICNKAIYLKAKKEIRKDIISKKYFSEMKSNTLLLLKESENGIDLDFNITSGILYFAYDPLQNCSPCINETYNILGNKTINKRIHCIVISENTSELEINRQKFGSGFTYLQLHPKKILSSYLNIVSFPQVRPVKVRVNEQRTR